MTDERPDIQQRVTACWNVAAGEYDAQPGHGLLSEDERAAWQALLREALPAAPADVLDVGTGTGFLAFRAHELGHRVTGIDLSERMLAVARGATAGMSAPPTFMIGDAIDPPLPAGSFDAVTNRHLLWTLRDPERALRSWHALLRPGGRLVLIDGIWSFDDDDAPPAQEHAGPESEEHDARDDFYNAETLAQLPMTRARSVDDIVSVVQAAGFQDVRPLDLSAIDEAEGHLESTKGRYGLLARR